MQRRRREEHVGSPRAAEVGSWKLGAFFFCHESACGGALTLHVCGRDPPTRMPHRAPLFSWLI